MGTDDTSQLGQRILVLGLGNVLLQDEGLGVRAVERLQERCALPPQVVALDGGTLGLDLLPHLGEATHLLMLDAVQADLAPGSLVRLEGDEIRIAMAHKMSLHQVGLEELLAVAAFQGSLPEERVLLGLEPASLDWGTELSPTVAAALDDLVAAATAQLDAWSVVST